MAFFMSSSSRAPTVSELVGAIDVRPVILPPSSTETKQDDGYAPTYNNIDVLWKPTIGHRHMTRSCSTDSDVEDVRRVSITEMGPVSPTLPVASPEYTDFATDKGMAVGAAQPRARRMSLSEMIFGSPGQRRFTWGEKNYNENGEQPHRDRKTSVTEDERFKEIMRLQNRVLNDEVGLGGFKAKDYRK